MTIRKHNTHIIKNVERTERARRRANRHLWWLVAGVRDRLECGDGRSGGHAAADYDPAKPWELGSGTPHDLARLKQRRSMVTVVYMPEVKAGVHHDDVAAAVDAILRDAGEFGQPGALADRHEPVTFEFADRHATAFAIMVMPGMTTMHVGTPGELERERQRAADEVRHHVELMGESAATHTIVSVAAHASADIRDVAPAARVFRGLTWGECSEHHTVHEDVVVESVFWKHHTDRHGRLFVLFRCVRSEYVYAVTAEEFEVLTGGAEASPLLARLRQVR